MEYIVEQLKIPIQGFTPIEDNLKRLLGPQYINVSSYEILKKSIDARDKNNILLIFTLKIVTNSKLRITKNNIKEYIPELKQPFAVKTMALVPIIVGMGPAGLFTALRLLEYGIAPRLIERGKDINRRISDVNKLWSAGILDEESNALFGEGGAGTFSDGKLSTQKNDPLNQYILRKLVEFGAPGEILYEAKPHIGTDMLPNVLKNIRDYLLKQGCKIDFSARLTDIIINNDAIKGLMINNNEYVSCNIIFLATGHSAHDTYELLNKKKIKLEPKSFAVGFRVEHTQTLINKIQYGQRFHNHPLIGQATYKLTFQASNGRGVYSFCMCPGGYVINTSNQPGRLVINGMSSFARDSGTANSAIVVGISPSDFYHSSPLDGLTFIRNIEQKAYSAGTTPFFAPAQRLLDFMKNKQSNNIKSTYKPGVTSTDLNSIYPDFITKALKDAFPDFEHKMKGFYCEEAILIGVETRTSSPVRIPRNPDGQHIELKGLYPVGEGAGYSGGIMSSALDGLKAADKLAISF